MYTTTTSFSTGINIITELTQQAPYKSKPTPQKPSKNSSIEPEKWKHLYLDLPELLDTLPDLGLEAFEHVHMLRRQSLERVLSKCTNTESG